MHRWFRVAGGVSLNLCLGAAYVYSVFLTPLQREFGWTRSELSAAFTLSIAFIAVGVLAGGRWQDRRGPAVVSLAGAILFSAGIFLSRYTDSLAWLYGCYGVVVGLGSGIGYTCPLSVGMKWFPERRGLVTGMMVMGYGAGGAVIAPLAGYLIHRFGWRDTFGILGAGFLAVTVAGSMFLRNPPEGWRPPGWSPPAAEKGAARGGRDFLPREMVGTGAFRRMWAAYAFGTAAGLMVTTPRRSASRPSSRSPPPWWSRRSRRPLPGSVARAEGRTNEPGENPSQVPLPGDTINSGPERSVGRRKGSAWRRPLRPVRGDRSAGI